MESGLTKQQIFSELTKSTHRDLDSFLPTISVAARDEGEFLAHLISWNRIKGEVRDSKVALPVISLSEPKFAEPILVENSLAHLATLRPRELVKAVRFSRKVRTPGHGGQIRRLVERYLRALEASEPRFDRVVAQHRRYVRELYSFPYPNGGGIKPSERANVVLNRRLLDHTRRQERPAGSIHEVIAALGKMSPLEAAGNIIAWKVPFLVAAGAMGALMKDPTVLMALIERMSPTELNNNMATLERAGVKKDPVLRAALEKGLKRLAETRGPTLKLSKGVEALEDEELQDKLQAVQEKKFDSSGVEGDWLVIADRSGSMRAAIELSRSLSAALARLAKGKVYLVFIDDGPRFFDATGKTFEQISAETSMIQAGGGTCIGAGLQYLVEYGLQVDGVAIVSDGGENRPPAYAQAHAAYLAKFGKELPTYLFRTEGDANVLVRNCAIAGVSVQEFPMSKVDYASIPNIAQALRTNRYGLIDEVMAAPLLTIDSVLGVKGSSAAS